MRHWKIFYLVLSVLLFIILIIPVFQNIQYEPYVIYFKYMSFVNMYKICIPLCMIEWALVTLYIQSLFTDINRQWPKKFDLGE